jgi:uncharacterized tellurite resistance protein B-like protein
MATCIDTFGSITIEQIKNDENQFENNTFKSLIENKYNIPENFLNNIITKINKLNDNIKNGNNEIIREIDNEPVTIINPNNDELPF